MMNAPRVAIEKTLLNSSAEAISRCPCLYWTAKITAATGAGRALVRTARRTSADGERGECGRSAACLYPATMPTSRA